MSCCNRHMNIIVALLMLGGCSTTSQNLADSSNQRRPDVAARLADQATPLLGTDDEEAASLLLQAIQADPFCGMAHNNLGVIELNRGHLYEAATEFESARRLLPGHPGPRCNLALVYEEAGRLDDAKAAYETALEVQPGHLPSMQGLASIIVRIGASDDRLPELLENISIQSDSIEWRNWAAHRRLAVLSDSGDLSRKVSDGPSLPTP